MVPYSRRNNWLWVTLELTPNLGWATGWREVIMGMRPWRDKSKVRGLELWGDILRLGDP